MSTTERFSPKPGTRILYPLYDAKGVLLLPAGSEVTKCLCDLLSRRSIQFDLKVQLEVVEGGSVGSRIPMNRPAFMIGRGPECNIRPNDPCVSMRHCRLKKFAGSVLLVDLQSTNGTLLNGTRIETPTELQDGDQIQVGRFVFSIDIYADVAATSAEDQQALNSWILDEAAREPAVGPTLFTRENRAAEHTSVVPT